MSILNSFSKVLKSSIVHPSGKKMVMLGGLVFDQRERGGLVSEFKWVDGEPVMILYKRTLGNNSPAFIIEMKDAYQFAASDGYATKQLLSELSLDAARAIGEVHDKALVHQIITAILDGIPDLLKMPPEPSEQEVANRFSTGNDELSIKVDGKTVIEVQI